MSQISYIYGDMPSLTVWSDQWEAANNAGELRRNRYEINLNSADSQACENYNLGSGLWTCDQLHAACLDIARDFQEGNIDIDHRALDLVSCILEHLGFEWI